MNDYVIVITWVQTIGGRYREREKGGGRNVSLSLQICIFLLQKKKKILKKNSSLGEATF